MFYFHAPQGCRGTENTGLLLRQYLPPRGVAERSEFQMNIIASGDVTSANGDREAVEEEYGRKPNSCNVFRLTPG
jgi:hypothetical protein